MKPILSLAASLALALPAAAATGAPSAAPPPSNQPSNPFAGLWTPWDGVAREAAEAEAEAEARVRREAEDAGRRAAMREEGRSLGDRVGEVVRLGDCAAGERMAREAGDFPLVQAVRAHCGAVQASTRSR